MNERLLRLAAIIRADLLIRFRRMSTLVVFLLLTAFAWIWVPDPASGKALIQMDGRRALYNSAAVGMATATLAMMFVGLFGFYVISNAVRRDVLTRCGFVMASTTMRSSEYLFGKFAGNVVFLATFIAGYMVSSMGMLVIRGEAPLQPLLFIWQYALLVPPAIAMVSVLAVLFESVPGLSGRFGDVVYFFVWVGGAGIMAAMRSKGTHGPGLSGYLDFSGFVFLFESLSGVLHTTSMSIGQSPYDMSKPPFVFHGLPLPAEWIPARIVSTFAPLALLGLARLSFHRFDPSRVRAVVHQKGRSFLGWVERMVRPVSRLLWLFAPRSGDSLLSAARSDVLITITMSPLILLGALGVAVAAVATDAKSFAGNVVPIAFAVAAIFIAEIPCREVRKGTVPLVFASPRLRRSFVWWKALSTAAVALVILAVPLARAALEVNHLPALVVGFAFVIATATALGTATSNPKSFIVLFLSFWYLVLNDHGHTPALDFAGTSGVATPAVTLAYLLIAAAALAIAELFHRRRLQREY